MRFFIALEVPPNSLNELSIVQQNIKKLIPLAKLTDTNKLHITIAFIGEEPDILKNQIIDVIKKASQDIPPFSLTPSYIDGFPSIHHPNVLWIGVKGDVDKLIIITERIRDGLRDLNLDVDQRRFVPHIAIAKLKDYDTSETIENNLQSMIYQNFEPIPVSSIKLFESVTDNGFHRHNTLSQIPLK